MSFQYDLDRAIDRLLSHEYNALLQDDCNGNLLLINTTTGEYQFSNCAGFLLSGKGTVTKKGGLITLQHVAGDRRVQATLDTSSKKGTASIQVLSSGRTFTISDRNTGNNTCLCN